MTQKDIKKRLAYLRKEIRQERISYSELTELQALAKYIEPGDTELLEAAGIPEARQYMKTIEEIQLKAKQLAGGMDWKEFSPEDKRVIITAEQGTSLCDELVSLVYGTQEKCQISTNSAYQFTMEALALIADASDIDLDNIREISAGIEADSYTSELTTWLDESPYHVYYLTQALEQGGIEDGFQALSMAQVLCMTDVLDKVIDYLLEND